METKYYIATGKLNARLEETALDKDDIVIEGVHMTRLTSKPKGRSIARRLSSTSGEESIIIYK